MRVVFISLYAEHSHFLITEYFALLDEVDQNGIECKEGKRVKLFSFFLSLSVVDFKNLNLEDWLERVAFREFI